MVSVIIPNYNNEHYIQQCVQSVLGQSFDKLEVIVVDDCSTDNSWTILQKLAKQDSRLCLLQNEQNMGVVKTRARGIAQAKWPYITTLDGDDYYYSPSKLENEVALIQHYQQQMGEDVIAFSNTVHVNVGGELIDRQINPHNLLEGWIFDRLLLRKCAVPRDFVFLKSHYEQAGGYDPQIPVYEDWDLKLRLARIARFVYTHQDGVAYRQTQKGLSSVSIFRHARWKNHVFNKNVGSLRSGSERIKSTIYYKLTLLREIAGAMRLQLFHTFQQKR